jgi:hypothetical protein
MRGGMFAVVVAVLAASIYIGVEALAVALTRATPAPCACHTDSECAQRCGGSGGPE